MNPFLFTRLSGGTNARLISIRTVLVCCSLTGLLTGCTDDHRSPSDSKVQQVQQAVDKVRADLEKDLGNPVPSLNVLIQTPTDRIFVSSVPSGNAPVTETANFRFASNTKHFTATAILNMHEDGWLNYKARITDLIPGTTMPYVPNTPAWAFPYKDQITIEQLLQHRAGVFDVDNKAVPGFNNLSYTEAIQNADPAHQFTTEEMVNQLIIHKLFASVPGAEYNYSNTGYSILGYIIARVYSTKSGTAKTYGDYMTDYIVGPGAAVPVAIHFPARADDTVLPAPRVVGTVRYPDRTIIYGDYNMSAQIAEGNGIGTVDALNTYIRTLMKGQNVLLPTTVKSMQTDDLGGFFLKNLGYGKNGARIGNLSLMMYDPLTDVSVVTYLPLWDLTQGKDGGTSFLKCFNSITDAAYAARTALGYPGKP